MSRRTKASNDVVESSVAEGEVIQTEPVAKVMQAYAVLRNTSGQVCGYTPIEAGSLVPTTSIMDAMVAKHDIENIDALRIIVGKLQDYYTKRGWEAQFTVSATGWLQQAADGKVIATFGSDDIVFVEAEVAKEEG